MISKQAVNHTEIRHFERFGSSSTACLFVIDIVILINFSIPFSLVVFCILFFYGIS
nr:MAG TPA: hypothetical protein [Caudoviricetes sp.]